MARDCRMTPETDIFDLKGLQVCLPEALAEVYKRYCSRCAAKGMLIGPVVLECDIATALEFDKAARELEFKKEMILPPNKWFPEKVYRFYDPPIDILISIGSERQLKFEGGPTLVNYNGGFGLTDYSKTEILYGRTTCRLCGQESGHTGITTGTGHYHWCDHCARVTDHIFKAIKCA